MYTKSTAALRAAATVSFVQAKVGFAAEIPRQLAARGAGAMDREAGQECGRCETDAAYCFLFSRARKNQETNALSRPI